MGHEDAGWRLMLAGWLQSAATEGYRPVLETLCDLDIETIMAYVTEGTRPAVTRKRKAQALKVVVEQTPENLIQTFTSILEVSWYLFTHFYYFWHFGL